MSQNTSLPFALNHGAAKTYLFIVALASIPAKTSSANPDPYTSQAAFLSTVNCPWTVIDFETTGDGISVEPLQVVNSTEWLNLGVIFEPENANNYPLYMWPGPDCCWSPVSGTFGLLQTSPGGDDNSWNIFLTRPVPFVGFWICDNEFGGPPPQEYIRLFDADDNQIGPDYAVPWYGINTNDPAANYFRGFICSPGEPWIKRVSVHLDQTQGDTSILDDFYLPSVLGFVGGDINVDGSVDGLDIGAFVAVLLETPNGHVGLEQCAADMNGDGQVNWADVAEFVGRLVAS